MTATWHDHVIPQDSFLLRAQAQNGLPGPLVKDIRQELHPQAAEYF